MGSDWRKLAGAVVIVTALASCTSVSASPGPLGGPGDPGQVCTPLRLGAVLSYGFTAFRNSGDSTVMIDKAELTDPRGLRVIAAYVVPGTARFAYGVESGFPPERPLPPGVDWSARQNASGAQVPPMTKSQQDSLLLVVRATAHRGSAKGVSLWYHTSHQQFFLQTNTRLLTVDRPSCAH